MNRNKLQEAIQSFTKEKALNAAYDDENWNERKERRLFYQNYMLLEKLFLIMALVT